MNHDSFTVCLLLGSEWTSTQTEIIEKPIDFYAKVIRTPQANQVEEEAIIPRTVHQKKENLITPKEKKPAKTPVAAAKGEVKKRAIRKPAKK